MLLIKCKDCGKTIPPGYQQDRRSFEATNFTEQLEKRPNCGNVKPIRLEREPMSDVTETDKEVKVVVETPGVSKENIEINTQKNKVEVKTEATKRKYHEVIEIPLDADIETAKSNYNSGILEIIFKKKVEGKPKGKNITLDQTILIDPALGESARAKKI